MGWGVFNSNVQYKVGVGDRVKLWKDSGVKIFLSNWLFQYCTILLQTDRLS